jgi:hypothetical protein
MRKAVAEYLSKALEQAQAALASQVRLAPLSQPLPRGVLS